MSSQIDNITPRSHNLVLRRIAITRVPEKAKLLKMKA